MTAAAAATATTTTATTDMSKKYTPLWREARFEVKTVTKNGFGALLEVEMSKKCTPLWREAHFEVNMLKTPHARMSFRCRSAW